MRNQELSEERSGVLNSTFVIALCGIPFMRSAIHRGERFAAGVYMGTDCSVPVNIVRPVFVL